MSDSWTQEGRKAKHRSLAKAEEQAEAGVGRPRKRDVKRFAIEYRCSPQYLAYVADCSPGLRVLFHSEWRVYQKYHSEKSMLLALTVVSDRNDWLSTRFGFKTYEYRVKK